MAINKPSPSPSIDPKEKRAHFPSLKEGTRKVKKNRGPPPPAYLTSSSSKVPVMEAEMEVRASLDLGDAPPASASEAPEGREKGLVAIVETQAKASEAHAFVMESLIWVTKSTMKAKAVVAKVKRAVAPITGMIEGEEARPSIAQEGVPISSEIVCRGWIGT